MLAVSRAAMLLAAGAIAIASTAKAGIPPTFGDVGEGGFSINVSAMLASGAAPTHENVLKHIRVFDDQQNPIAGSTVVIDFRDCVDGAGPAGADIEIADTQPFAGLLVNCTNKWVAAVTNAAGIARFSVIGYATNAGLTQLSPAISDVGHTTQCAEVRADGFLIGTLNVGAFDQNGIGGLDPTDFSLLLGDRQASLIGPVGTGAYRGRSDYDGDGGISPIDLALWLGVRNFHVINGGNGASGVACTP